MHSLNVFLALILVVILAGSNVEAAPLPWLTPGETTPINPTPPVNPPLYNAPLDGSNEEFET
ncbi:uncharacterized protein PSFLO_01541 [Pseudozyma flocculosa]|uniref:Secreted protein n=1 Tax=Pseudozyma flocculosa TaxID=84751 RepID=A0A5C3EW32_9BASI|nr:uncharacterized protein PSFLO_01541 [Pseudozyma flocculosa]